MSNSTALNPGYASDSDNYLKNTSGLLSWMFTLDHKRIGIMYLIGILTAFFIGGLLAMLIRLHLLSPDGFTPMTNDQYNQVFTLHGAIMVFLFIIPSVPAALGNFLVPQAFELEERDVAANHESLALCIVLQRARIGGQRGAGCRHAFPGRKIGRGQGQAGPQQEA